MHNAAHSVMSAIFERYFSIVTRDTLTILEPYLTVRAVQQWIASQEHPDAQTFVAQVDATAACQLCPTSIEFTGQASLGRESTSGLVPEQARPGSAYNADVSVHVSWPYRIWRRGKSKPLSLDQSDP